MANKEYTITMADGVETTVLLSDEDAKARGLKPSDAKAATPANKSASPANKSASKREEIVAKSFGAKNRGDGS